MQSSCMINLSFKKALFLEEMDQSHRQFMYYTHIQVWENKIVYVWYFPKAKRENAHPRGWMCYWGEQPATGVEKLLQWGTTLQNKSCSHHDWVELKISSWVCNFWVLFVSWEEYHIVGEKLEQYSSELLYYFYFLEKDMRAGGEAYPD